MNNKKLSLLAAAAALSLLTTQGALAQKKYDTGASDTEIKIGNVEAYSGPASAYGIIGKTEEAYFKMINDQGGINGRKINWISYDDGYSPPKTVEQIRKLIESDEVFLVFNALGTPTQTAVQKYHNAKKVPQLFLATGASKWNDPKDFPMDHGLSAELPRRSPDLCEIHPEDTSPTPRSRCSTPMTISARTTSPA